jgi:hypothetical protein
MNTGGQDFGGTIELGRFAGWEALSEGKKGGGEGLSKEVFEEVREVELSLRGLGGSSRLYKSNQTKLFDRREVITVERVDRNVKGELRSADQHGLPFRLGSQ